MLSIMCEIGGFVFEQEIPKCRFMVPLKFVLDVALTVESRAGPLPFGAGVALHCYTSHFHFSRLLSAD